MSFTWEDDQVQLYTRLKQLGDERLSTDVDARERSQSLSRHDWQQCADAGVHGLLIPPAYGGAGLDPVTCARALEGFGHGCRDNGLLMAVGAHVLAVEVPIWKFGTDLQRTTYLPGLVSGTLIGCHAITEPTAGSDALALTTIAERDGESYRLTGHKRYVTNAPMADVFIVYATIDTALGFTGVTAFLLERGDTGISVRESNEKMGLRTAPWGDIELDGCLVPASRRLGVEKQGRAILELTMRWERALLLAPWLGVLDREIQDCIAHSRERRQFGRRISDFQSVSNRLVDMRLNLEIARLLVARAATELTVDQPTVFPEMAKLFTSEAAVEILSSVIQVYGAIGYTTARSAERSLRDAYGMTISSGTSDMQKTIIAARLGIN